MILVSLGILRNLRILFKLSNLLLNIFYYTGIVYRICSEVFLSLLCSLCYNICLFNFFLLVWLKLYQLYYLCKEAIFGFIDLTVLDFLDFFDRYVNILFVFLQFFFRLFFSYCLVVFSIIISTSSWIFGNW